MQYQVSREGQLYGPYTLEDLQRYVTSGNVLLTDLAKSEDMPNWIPVAQILGTAPAAPPAYGAPSAYPAPAYPAPTGIPYPDPPNLPWLLVMLFSFFTCFTGQWGIFTMIWNILLCLWVRKVQPSSKALMLYITCYAIGLVGTIISLANSMPNIIAIMHHGQPAPPNIPLVIFGGLINLTSWIVRIIARFTLANSIEMHYNIAEPMGLRLSPIMTFFFGNLYFTYHINRLMDHKLAMRYRNTAIGLQ
jgi:GYF domain 2